MQDANLIQESDKICPICYDQLISPLSLPCKHTFCGECLNISLQKYQNCPLCRRICCKLIGDEYQTPEQIIEQATDTPGTNLPCLQFELPIPINVDTEIMLYEPKYIQLANIAIKTNLLVCVDKDLVIDGIKYCDIFQIIKIKPMKVQDTDVYYCLVKNIARAQVFSQTHKVIDASQNQILYFNSFKLLQDNFDYDEIQKKKLWDDLKLALEIFKSFYEDTISNFETFSHYLYKEIINMQSLDQPTLDSISNLSLQILYELKMPVNNFQGFYYSTDLQMRLEIIQKHSEAIQQIMINDAEFV